jgi:ribonuclease HI
MSKKVRLYTDGGSRGNPGPAASGAVIYAVKDGEEGKELATATRYLGKETNNQAEYTAVIIGLEKAKELGAKEVEVVMDSELAVRQLNGIYKVKNEELAKRFIEIWRLRQDFAKVTFRHVERAKNARADVLVNKCLDEQGA